MKTEQRFGLKTTSYTCTLISASSDTKIVKKSNKQKLNGKVISKCEDNGFLWPQPEANEVFTRFLEKCSILAYEAKETSH